MQSNLHIGLTYAQIKQIGLALPGVEESTSYGTPAPKVRGKLMLRLKEDLATVVLRTSWEAREQLMVLYPESFYITDHYRNHPWVLLRLSSTPAFSIEQMIVGAWRLVASKTLLAQYSSE